MAKKEIKIQITKENYDFLMELKAMEQNKNKNISDLINKTIEYFKCIKELGEIQKKY